MFGTDGIRGRAYRELTPHLTARIGAAVRATFDCDRVVLGHDPRESAADLIAGLLAGLAGVRVELLGVAPTPAVAYLSAVDGVPGIVVSASHNPYYDNGVKIFAPGGRKLSDAEQDAIAAALASPPSPPPAGSPPAVPASQESPPSPPAAPASIPRAPTCTNPSPPSPPAAPASFPALSGCGVGAAVGVDGDGDVGAGGVSTPGADGSTPALVSEAAGRLEEYLDHVAATVPPGALAGMRVVVDGANGACSALGPALLRRLGATVREVACSPDGRNINEGCGTTAPALIAGETRPGEVGLAFDGDGDRVVAYDQGLIDGDQIIALCGIDRHERSRLAGSTVVVTVMSNLGLHQAMAGHGIDVVTTPVGDRHVLAAMEAGGWELGGEQSGHVIFGDLATTGDGLVTAVQLLELRARRGRPLGVLAAEAMTRHPQVLRNVAITGDADRALADLEPAVAAARSRLGERGRILVRTSGTEPLIRIMVEAPTEPEANQVAKSLATTLTATQPGLI